MKRLLVAVSLSLLASSAFAADAVVDEVVILDEGFDWSGVYVGAHVGYAWGDTDYSSGGLLQPNNVDPFVIFDHYQDEDGDGAFGGIQIGANWQNGALVYGVEADVSFANVESQQSLATNTGPLWIDEELEFFGTVRGRVGYAAGRFLPYVTGGLAWANYELSTPLGDTGYSEDKTLFGWTVGVGGEVAVTQTVSLKLEYLYADFEDKTYDVQQNSTGYIMPVQISPSLQTVRLGLNYRF